MSQDPHIYYTQGYEVQRLSENYQTSLQVLDGQVFSEHELCEIFKEFTQNAGLDHPEYGDRPRHLHEMFIRMDWIRPLPTQKYKGRYQTLFYVQVLPEHRLPFSYDRDGVTTFQWCESRSPILDQIQPPTLGDLRSIQREAMNRTFIPWETSGSEFRGRYDVRLREKILFLTEAVVQLMEEVKELRAQLSNPIERTEYVFEEITRDE